MFRASRWDDVKTETCPYRTLHLSKTNKALSDRLVQRGLHLVTIVSSDREGRVTKLQHSKVLDE